MENKKQLPPSGEDLTEEIKDFIKGLFHWIFVGFTLLNILVYIILLFRHEAQIEDSSKVTTLCVAYIAFRLMPYRFLDVFNYK